MNNTQEQGKFIFARKNFQALYLAASASEIEYGLNWYKNANTIVRRIAKSLKLSVSIVSGVMSALSPNNKWERNILDCEALCKAFVLGLDIEAVKVCTFNVNKIKAWGILNGDNVESVIVTNKTLNFHLNIMYPTKNFVCIDTHMLNVAIHGFKRVALQAKTKAPTANDEAYYGLADAIVELAFEYGIVPCQMQAIIWAVYRNLTISEKDV